MEVKTHGYSIHLEPSDMSAFRIFLERDGDRVSMATPFIPSDLKELVQTQRSSYSLEEDFIQHLSHKDIPEIHIHTNQGVFAVHWEPTVDLRAKTYWNWWVIKFGFRRFW